MADSVDLLRRMREATAAPPEADEAECAALGYLRGVRERAAMLELRFRDGDARAFAYSWLGEVTYAPSAGLLLRFTGDRAHWVLIEGSNLDRDLGAVSLYRKGVLRHRVTWVREMSPHELGRAGEGELLVERIRVATSGPDGAPPPADWLAPFLNFEGRG